MKRSYVIKSKPGDLRTLDQSIHRLQVLKDDEKRSMYDQLGPAGFEQAESGGMPGGGFGGAGMGGFDMGGFGFDFRPGGAGGFEDVSVVRIATSQLWLLECFEIKTCHNICRNQDM